MQYYCCLSKKRKERQATHAQKTGNSRLRQEDVCNPRKASGRNRIFRSPEVWENIFPCFAIYFTALCPSHSSRVVPENCSLTKGLLSNVVIWQVTSQVDSPGQVVKSIGVLGQEETGQNKQKASQAMEWASNNLDTVKTPRVGGFERPLRWHMLEGLLM